MIGRTALAFCLMLVDEAIETSGGETPTFPGRERLNRGLSLKGFHRAGEPDPWQEPFLHRSRRHRRQRGPRRGAAGGGAGSGRWAS